jgi:alpha-1,6-mannosyltransferase
VTPGTATESASAPVADPVRLPRLLLAGTIGSALLALGGVGVGAVPVFRDPVADAFGLSWLHTSYSGRWIALALVIAGVVLLTGAWWRIGRRLSELGPRTLLRVAGLWSLPLLVAPPLFSRDVYAYAGQANLVVNGRDPYDVGPGALLGPLVLGVDPVWLATPSPYGPLFLGLAGAVVELTGERLVLAVLGLRLLAVLGLLLVAWGLPRLAVAHGVPAERALWLGLANPLVLLHGVGGAHNDALMVGLLVAGLAVAQTVRLPSWVTRHLAVRMALAAALITLAALVKVPAVAALAFLPLTVHAGWRERARAALVVLVSAAGTAVVVTAVSGLGWGWLTALGAGRARLSLFSPVTGLGVAVGEGLTALGVVDDPGPVLDVVLGLGVLAGVAVACVLLLRATELGALRALGLTLVVVVVLGPVVQPWYLLWGVVLLAAVAGERSLLALGALSAALCFAVLPSGKSVVRPPLYGLPIIAAAGLAALEVRRAAAGETVAGNTPPPATVEAPDAD